MKPQKEMTLKLARYLTLPNESLGAMHVVYRGPSRTRNFLDKTLALDTSGIFSRPRVPDSAHLDQADAWNNPRASFKIGCVCFGLENDLCAPGRKSICGTDAEADQ